MSFRSLLPFGHSSLSGKSHAADPLSLFHRDMSQALDRMMVGFPMLRGGMPDQISFVPAIDMTDKGDRIEVTVEVPGVEEKDLEVQLSDSALTIRGEKATETETGEADKAGYILERSYGSFSRTLPLPVDVEASSVTATFDKGVLRVTLPKSPDSKERNRKIDIQKA